jgi:hypothetical protein
MKQESSFCEQKEAKKLYPLANGDRRAIRARPCHWPASEVFFASFLFTKKKTLPF